MYIMFSPYSLLHLFLMSSPLLLVTTHPDRTCFTFLFSVFVKKMTFSLFKIAIQGVSL
jgi:hypothetical protein